ncbi:MAG TPA: hypothetical protein PLG17_00440 [Thermodesulfobacteriota bacterium]|nr:hypothetical protein [Deltaproteobacteria bacterium]HNR12504.1 hypothetical protein [Thermodesulfobacteriota bacterium]HNU70498.1 hypothetical protein [Thermodesulfobacteriota bacterium]HOC39648.1 hypothetical protein [Thermodesulfobacteriota bacterium]HQO76957.1 hypothetical protein [Thermodesulfobacteriota bacterium]
MNIPACCEATAIGSFPHRNAGDAVRLIMKTIPRIPVWPQLPAFPEEGMTSQYNEGIPGLVYQNEKLFFDTRSPGFDSELLGFYEDYLQALELETLPFNSRFGISAACSQGIPALLEVLKQKAAPLTAVKGQISGPVSLGTSLKDQDGRSAYYDNRLREVVVKTLALKARWQIHQFRFLGVPVIIFIDEPSLAAYGSTAFLGISEDDVKNDLLEIIEVIHADGGLAGIHCCENTDWAMLMRSGCDILNFDAYSFFGKLILYADAIKEFLAQGNVLAWGLVPTANPDDVRKETAASLVQRWNTYVDELAKKGIAREMILRQSLITPSCGTGSLALEVSQQVMELLQEVSKRLQDSAGAA